MNILKSFSREHILFGFSFVAFGITYGLWHYLSRQQEELMAKTSSFQHDISEKKQRLGELSQTAEQLRSILRQDRRKRITRHALGQWLKASAESNKFLRLHFTFMPEKIVHKDKMIVVKKSLVHLQFTAEMDSYVWDFVKTLYSKFPGIIHSREFKLEREDASGQDIQKTLNAFPLLKGTHSFEWYNIFSLSEERPF